MMFKKMLKNEKGLTLIELLAVIVILGIIAAIAIPSIGGIIQKSREDAVKADALQILNAAKVYVSSNGLEDTSLTHTDLEDYVTGLESDFTNYTVTVGTDSNEYKLTTTDTVTAGNREMKFNNATLANIKAKHTVPETGNIVIPAQ
nr:prepilin-type N-terminal cleavage/methylation domain-containing protein [Metabacillus iocasae]